MSDKPEKVEVSADDVIDAIDKAEDLGVHGSVYKKPMSRRLADIFISDQADTVGGFIVEEVIIPGVKDALLDILHGSIDRIFGASSYGGYNSKRRRDAYDDDASWRKYHDRGGKSKYGYDDDYDDDYRPRRRSYEETSFSLCTDNKGKRNRVMERLTDIMREQHYLSIYDVKTTIGFKPREIDPSDDDWGWDDMEGITARRKDYKGKYILELPRPDDITDLKREYRERMRR